MSAVCMRSLDGIQPLLRQVPPILLFSTIATFKPLCAAACATSSPAPLPITIRSYSLIVFGPEWGFNHRVYDTLSFHNWLMVFTIELKNTHIVCSKCGITTFGISEVNVYSIWIANCQ